MKYQLIKTMYRLHRITAAEVWAYADAGDITEAQAVSICGPRPKGDGNES